MQFTTKLFRSTGGSSLLLMAAVSLLWVPGTAGALAQTAEVAQSAATSALIPQQVRYAGAMPNRAGETVEAVFKIYATAEGGEPLWTETQQVSVSADGGYGVLLGAASESGLPQAVFAAGQARWVGVTIDRAEGARSPLSSVAYAMKAGDAESVGGLAAANLATKSDLAKLAQSVVTTVEAQPQFQSQPETTPSGSGTLNYVPLWTGSATLGNSGIFQATSGFVGIGTTTPGGPLQLATGAQGGANATMMLTQTSAASGNYYADIGLYNTHGLIGNLSALGAGYPAGNLFGANDVVFLGGQQNAPTNLIFVTNTSGALKFGTGGYGISNERLRIGAAGGVSVGNTYVGTDPGPGNMILSGSLGVGTTAPSANLEVNGTAKFDGLVTFAAAQTFPGTGAGTITKVTASSPLTGGGSTGAVTVGLNTAALETTLNGVYAQLGAIDTFSGTAIFNNGISSNASQGGSAIYATGTNGTYGVYATSDSGYGVAGISATGEGVYGSSGTGSGGYFVNTSDNEPTILALNMANYTVGSGNPTAIDAEAPGTQSVGLFAAGTALGVWGSTATTGAEAVTGQATNGYGGVFQNASLQFSSVYLNNTAEGTAAGGPIALEAVAPGINADGIFTLLSGNGAYGVYGESDGTLETGSGRTPAGVKGVALGVDGDGLVGDAGGSGGYGVYARASGLADTSRYASAGVYALADAGIGVEGFSVGQSSVYDYYQSGLAHAFTAGVWGDTSGVGGSYDLAGVMGTADNNIAGQFDNNSASYATLTAYNYTSTGPTGLFKVFKAATPEGTCGIGDGNLSCTGQVKMLATTGARTVETYATQSAENWMEDYGTGAMQRGVGVVQIDAGFAETVTADASYHVFLTPRGDSKGLYVTNPTAGSFEVRESGGGTSSISFDYKIVAKRRGYEAQRLVDVTERFNVEQTATKLHMPATMNVAASKGVVEPRMAERPANRQTPARLARPSARGGLAAPVVRKNATQPKVAGAVVPK